MPGQEGNGLSLGRKLGDNEDIKIEASMFDEAVSASKSDDALGIENV